MDLFVQMIDFAIETAIYVRSFKMITKNNELFTMLQMIKLNIGLKHEWIEVSCTRGKKLYKIAFLPAAQYIDI